MGINGLLLFLKSVFSKSHISNYRGLKIGIDGYCWLHKAIYTNNLNIIENPKSVSFAHFIKRKLKKLIINGIVPILIFDGNKLPIKTVEEFQRNHRRQKLRTEAEDLIKQGKFNEGRAKLAQAIDITPQMVHSLLDVIKNIGIEHIIAPYEADAQLAYLDKINYIDVVCTEDSDLIAYGCRRIIYKLDKHGNCFEIKNCDIFKMPEFKSFTQSQFLEFCVLSG